MITDQQAQILATASNAAYPGSLDYINMRGYGYTEAKAFPTDPNTGFSAVVFKKEGTQEYIVAFTGTQSAQDAAADIGLGTLQWENNQASVMNYLNNLPADAKIDFTGHSLGGALAQYAAYDYLAAHPSATASLTTYNGLGGMNGLQQMDRGYDSSVASRVEAAHFFAESSGMQDIVARLGGEHFGGNTYAIPMAQENAWLGSIHSAWDDFKNLTVPQNPTSPNYLNIDGAQNLASFFGFFGDDGRISNTEGALRALGGVLTALSTAPAEEIDILFDALFPPSFPLDIDWGIARDLMPPQIKSLALVYGLEAIAMGNVRQFFDYLDDLLTKTISDGNTLINNLINQIANIINTTIVRTPIFGRIDPLALDLDGDGIETIAMSASTAMFDLDGDSFAEKTGWIAKDDGILVLDRNNNGQIDDNSEVFGKSTINGFDELKQLDANTDGVMDTNDSMFAALQVWQDLNSNGITDAGELKTLSDAGISSINLTYAESATDSNGNLISQTGAFTRTDGTQGVAADVDLQVNQAYSSYNGDFTLDAETLALPWLRGYGQVAALPIAASQSADLKACIAQLAQQTDAKTLLC
ncbi:Mbeg1-like protein [Geobacter sp.]|uniref:lipase family protein n=1 Tax=Geobacter sp. TaxID=46610 RepID=UPI001AC07E29|nr:Mbeg1-like protein [Geobacter sp.]CAG0968358.1 hypothetical protein ANRL4_01096 [Anaerolineae bacterium]